MLRPILLASVLASSLSVAPAFAQEREGHWFGNGEGDITLDLTHIQNDIYAMSINTVVPISDMGGGCAGGVDGEVIITGSTANFFVENEGYDANAEASGYNQRYCEIALTFNEDGTLITEEREGCLYYHGAACGFSGTLTHDAAGI